MEHSVLNFSVKPRQIKVWERVQNRVCTFILYDSKTVCHATITSTVKCHYFLNRILLTSGSFNIMELHTFSFVLLC